MREILFKAKRRDNNEWIVGYYCKYGDNHCIIEPTEFGIAKGVGIIPETLCEFAGLYDKNGKRIWENDIVKAPIYYDVGCYPYTKTKIVKVQIPNIYRMSIDGDFEVIGNSIDNPELLTAER
jgi:hypothetical protein